MTTTRISERLLNSMVQARKRAGLSQSAMAAILGVVPSTVNKVERDRKNTTVTALEAWAAACGGEVRLVFDEQRTLDLRHLNDSDYEFLVTLVTSLPRMSPDAKAGLQSMVYSMSRVVSSSADDAEFSQENVTKRRA